MIQGLDDVGWPDVPLVAMETEGADSFSAAVKAGKIVTIPDITRLAINVLILCLTIYNSHVLLLLKML